MSTQAEGCRFENKGQHRRQAERSQSERTVTHTYQREYGESTTVKAAATPPRGPFGPLAVRLQSGSRTTTPPVIPPNTTSAYH